jgi:hypothetical protein
LLGVPGGGGSVDGGGGGDGGGGRDVRVMIHREKSAERYPWVSGLVIVRFDVIKPHHHPHPHSPKPGSVG